MLGYDGDLYLLAFDHRGSFQKQLTGHRDDGRADVRDVAEAGTPRGRPVI